MAIPDGGEKRRGFRFETDDVIASVICDGVNLSEVRVVNLSTIGIGIETSSNPSSPNVQINFSESGLLKGLKLQAVQRRLQPLHDGKKQRYLIGYELHFESSSQQDLLHRWTSNILASPADNEELDAISGTESSVNPISGSFEIRFPRSEKEYEYCLNQAAPLRVHHALIQSKFFAALAGPSVFAFMSYLPELKDFKLYEGTGYSDQLEDFRKQGLKIAEVSLPYFNDARLSEGIASTLDLRKLQLMYSIFPHLLIYARRYAQTDLLVCLLPPYLQEFFRLWLFTDLPSEDSDQADDTQPGLMVLKIDDFFKEAPHKRPELMHSISTLESTPEIKNSFMDSYYPEQSKFLEIFGDKHSLVSMLTDAQKSYFKFLKH